MTRRRALPQPDLQQVLAVVDSPRSVDDLRRYFDTDRAAGDVPGNLGGAFELLAGGGDRPGSADRITADDLIAVQMLEVRVPTEVALQLLEGQLGRAVAAELACIPTDVAIHDPAGAELLADGGPADRAWRLLHRQDGVGWVITNKLLARKRPHPCVRPRGCLLGWSAQEVLDVASRDALCRGPPARNPTARGPRRGRC